jgi:hypothetical protein
MCQTNEPAEPAGGEPEIGTKLALTRGVAPSLAAGYIALVRHNRIRPNAW